MPIVPFIPELTLDSAERLRHVLLDELRRAAQHALPGCRIRMSDALEGTAAGLGFGSHAALIAGLLQAGGAILDARFDVDRFAAALSERLGRAAYNGREAPDGSIRAAAQRAVSTVLFERSRQYGGILRPLNLSIIPWEDHPAAREAFVLLGSAAWPRDLGRELIARPGKSILPGAVAEWGPPASDACKAAILLMALDQSLARRHGKAPPISERVRLQFEAFGEEVERADFLWALASSSPFPRIGGEAVAHWPWFGGYDLLAPNLAAIACNIAADINHSPPALLPRIVAGRDRGADPQGALGISQGGGVNGNAGTAGGAQEESQLFDVDIDAWVYAQATVTILDKSVDMSAWVQAMASIEVEAASEDAALTEAKRRFDAGEIWNAVWNARPELGVKDAEVDDAPDEATRRRALGAFEEGLIPRMVWSARPELGVKDFTAEQATPLNDMPGPVAG